MQYLASWCATWCANAWVLYNGRVVVLPIVKSYIVMVSIDGRYKKQRLSKRLPREQCLGHPLQKLSGFLLFVSNGMFCPFFVIWFLLCVACILDKNDTKSIYWV